MDEFATKRRRYKDNAIVEMAQQCLECGKAKRGMANSEVVKGWRKIAGKLAVVEEVKK